jgi:hypothetical protein
VCECVCVCVSVCACVCMYLHVCVCVCPPCLHHGTLCGPPGRSRRHWIASNSTSPTLRAPSGVTVVLQSCDSGVTVVLNWCYSDVTEVSQ